MLKDSKKHMDKCTCGNQNMVCDLSCHKCDDDLAYCLAKTVEEGFDVAKFVKHMKEYAIGPVGTCAICGRNYVFGGNTPRPVVNDECARCCAACHAEVVIPMLTEAAFSEKRGFGKGVKRKFAGRPNLSPQGIVRFVRDVGMTSVTEGGKTFETQGKFKYNISDAEYNAPFITFKKVGTDEVVSIDARKILWSSLRANGNLSIGLDGEWGEWLLWADRNEDEGINVNPGDEDKLHPLMTKSRLERAAELEAYINNELVINMDSKIRIYVRLRNRQTLNDYRYEIIVGSSDELHFVTYADCMFIQPDDCCGGISADIIRNLARELVLKLRPTGGK